MRWRDNSIGFNRRKNFMRTTDYLALALILLYPVGAAPDDSGHRADHRQAMPHMHRHWMAPPEAMHRRNPVPANSASMQRGRELFREHCAVCHGPQGRGDGPSAAGLNPKPVNLAAMAGHHPDVDYAWKIENGRGAMPAWKGTLGENQIWDLVNFIQTLGGADKSKHTRSPAHREAR